jgi:hypothetical protein
MSCPGRLQYWRGTFKNAADNFSSPRRPGDYHGRHLFWFFFLSGGRNAGNCAGSPDADAFDFCVAQIHSANACEDFVSVSRVIEIDSEVATRKREQLLAGAWTKDRKVVHLPENGSGGSAAARKFYAPAAQAPHPPAYVGSPEPAKVAT